MSRLEWHHTTVIAVRRGTNVALAADGQVTLGSTVMKHGAKKLRRLMGGNVLVGFSGSVADAMALFSKLEAKLETYKGQLERAAVELAKEWRTDKVLRNLEALLIAADRNTTLIISGSGEVLSPDNGVAAVGSGGAVALAAARVLLKHTSLPAGKIAEEAVRAAAEVDIYTNSQILVEELRDEKES